MRLPPPFLTSVLKKTEVMYIFKSFVSSLSIHVFGIMLNGYLIYELYMRIDSIQIYRVHCAVNLL